MTEFGNSPPRGRRAVPRTRASLIVELAVGAHFYPAILTEISRTGVRLRGVNSLTTGQELGFRAGSLRAMGEVVWFEGDECAIAFEFPIAAAEVDRIRILSNFVTSAGTDSSQHGA